MELKMVCGSWIGEDEEKVLNALRESDRWPDVDELSAITGVDARKVRMTLRKLKQQTQMAQARERFLRESAD